MSSFIQIGPRWSGGNEHLLGETLRGEWGWEGMVSTDAVLRSFMDPEQAIRFGSDIMLAPLGTATANTVNDAYDEDPVGIGEALRDRVHAVLYLVSNTDAMDNVSDSDN